MIRSDRLAPRVFLALALAVGVAAAGCDNGSQANGAKVPFDPDKAKSQEDSMKRAAEEHLKATKKKK